MTGQDGVCKDKPYVHWLYQAVGMGNRRLMKKLSELGTAEEIYELARKRRLVGKISEKYHQKAKHLEMAAQNYDVKEEYEKLGQDGISFVVLGEREYPVKLAAVSDAPYALYYAGRLPGNDEKAVALIGTRNCSEYGRYMAGQFGKSLAMAGIQVISGMARGIDGIGQQAALDAKGYSLGVLGCGVKICYPPEHKPLYEQLIAAGGICSEYPPDIEPRAMLFPPRNRIISGLCDAVLVIEAKERSGTLITVDMALEQGREVYALPGRATDPLSQGCNQLIRQGAALVTSPQELVRELKPDADNDGRADHVQQALFEIGGTGGQLLKLLDYQPKSMEQIQREYGAAYGCHVSIPKLCHELLQLCAVGYARQVTGSYYVKTRE